MKSLKLILLLLLILLTGTLILRAQQDPQFTQNMFYNMAINPGVAGNENAICATVADRMQWTGFKDAEGNKVAPETFFITIGAPLKFLHGGVSAVVMQDKLGFEKNISLKVGYAYQKNVGFGKMGIGAHIEFNNKSIDFGKLKPADEDPLLGQLGSKESDMLIDFSLGLFYNVPGVYYVGLSGTHLIQTKGKSLVEASDLRMNLDRTFYLTGGYQFSIPRDPDFEIMPSAMIKTNLSSLQVDISALVRYKELVWGGLSYRLQDAIGVILGMQYKNIKIGYSYDINVSKLKLSIGGGTHEIMVGYCFKLDVDKGRKSYKNTRFL